MVRSRSRVGVPRLWRFGRWPLAAAAGVSALTLLLVLPVRWLNPPASAYMLRQEAQTLQFWVEIEKISPQVSVAVLAAEDQRFLDHHGFDFASIREALETAVAGGRLRGASTISQQVARNLYLWPSRSLPRKLLEAWLTVWIELCWPKQRILEVYLNVAQFGPCVFGAEAASQRYFGVPATDLEPEQAALLAAVLPNPKQLRAWNPGPYAQERTAEVLALMEQFGSLSRLAPRGTFARAAVAP
jgi:monofunctional biosynthetic peptidoglycan transglycosylase